MQCKTALFQFRILIWIILFSSSAKSQSLPEQDCIGAIPLCQNIYTSTISYSGSGNIPNEINPLHSCLSSGEKNDVWYIFTAQNSGNVSFLITPFNPLDDYDWAVFNLTNKSCSQIFSDTTMEVSCNYDANIGCGGVTGPNGTQSGCGQTEPVIPVQAGETFVVNVSNYSSSQNGYTIDFSSSTATIFDNTPPQKIYLIANCSQDSVVLNFNEQISCSTIAQSGSDFIIADENGNNKSVSNAIGVGCSSSSYYTSQVKIFFNDKLSNSSVYYLLAQNGTDRNTVSDRCGNFILVGDTVATIVVQNNLSVNLGNDIVFCPKDVLKPVLNLPALTGALNTWMQNGQIISTASQLEITQPATYVGTVSYGNLCAASDTIVAAWKPIPQVEVGNDTTSCETNPVHLNPVVSLLAEYSWTLNGTFLSSDKNITANESGEYILSVSGNSICNSADTILIQVKKMPSAPQVDCPVISGNQNIFSWEIPDNTNYVEVSENNGITWIAANGTDGKSHSTSITIKHILVLAWGDSACGHSQVVSSKLCNEETPITISVNGQSLLTISGAEIPIQLEIADAIGRKIFFNGDYRNNWSANNLAKGAYCYKLKSGKARFAEGKFLILK